MVAPFWNNYSWETNFDKSVADGGRHSLGYGDARESHAAPELLNSLQTSSLYVGSEKLLVGVCGVAVEVEWTPAGFRHDTHSN